MKLNHHSQLLSPSRILLLGFFLFLFGLLYGCISNERERPFLTGQGTGIGNASLLVDDIDSAIKYFRDTLGFNIHGNAKAGAFKGSQAVSISIGDLSSFQIISKNDTLEQDSIAAFLRNNTTNGIRLFSLSSSSVDSAFISLTSAGLSVDSIQSYRTSSQQAKGWSWDTGNAQRKSLDFNSDNPPAHLPRFVESIGYNYADVNRDWNTYWLFNRMYNKHPNGVTGTSALKIAVRDLRSVARQYETMGFESISENDSIIKYSVFRQQELHLVNTQNKTDLVDFVSTRGDGVYAIQFDVENLDSTYHYFKNELPEGALVKTSERLTIAAPYAFGVQLEFVQEPEKQAILARKLSPTDDLDTLAIQHAGELYTKYCALCHGENREGYVADYAPSLSSKSLLATSMNNNFMRYTIQFGRANTAMGGYLNTQGGPMEYIEIELLLEYLNQMAEVEKPIELSREPVLGDIDKGAELYTQNCAICHGEKGEGVSAPALANPMTLATATDHFLRYAIAEGRDGTPMVAFKDQLSNDEIDGLTAFLRSRASGWDIPKPDSVKVPTPEEYVLNPDSEAPVFELREDRFVSAEQVNRALAEGKRMIILDARSEVAWRQMHIPGAAPVPYYEEPDNFIDNIPNDGTQIVIYCACPHAASGRVLNTLRRYGYKNTAIIDEGILVWAQMGFPVRNGS